MPETSPHPGHVSTSPHPGWESYSVDGSPNEYANENGFKISMARRGGWIAERGDSESVLSEEGVSLFNFMIAIDNYDQDRRAIGMARGHLAIMAVTIVSLVCLYAFVLQHTYPGWGVFFCFIVLYFAEKTAEAVTGVDPRK